MYSCILFDFDGTVYDTVEGITKSVQYAIRKHGLDAPLEELRCFAGPPLVEMFMEKFGFDRSTAEQVTREFRERYVPIGVYESAVFPEIRGLLEALRQAGKRVGVATSKPESLACQLLEREGMLSLFDVVAGAGDNGAGNAKWQVIGRAMEALGANKFQAFWSACVPQILPVYLSHSLYCFEMNVRASAILGYVGAGGLGITINERIGWRDYNSLGTVLLSLFVVVVIIDFFSEYLRKKLS